MVPKPNEKALLEALANQNSELGVFFARWNEIRSQSYTPDFLKSIEGAPDLNPDVYEVLEDLQAQGFVEDLHRLATKEGRHYKITFAGKQQLEVLKARQGFTAKFSKRRIRWFIGTMFAALVWFVNFGNPAYLCQVPLSGILEKCAEPPETLSQP
ncbi:MAG: hypothetical protein ACSHW1_19085 [Yoonia sp.]|uniref:hypothetical protein n=1 Tax=Yoonia sp. TaxID=2212373 RepID=UPI003EFA6C0A